MITYEAVEEARDALLQRIGSEPEIGIVLGSGLGAFADSFQEAKSFPFAELPGFSAATVSGHAGRLVAGRLGRARVVALQGRIHVYEGHPAWRATFPIRVLGLLGARKLILTNAAGALDASLDPGDLVRITDHINFGGENPLSGPNDERLGPRFPDLSAAYDPELGALLEETAAELGEPLGRGVYAYVRGPSYETPAEVRMLRALGAHLVGMSTVPETIVAAHMGLRVVGLSLVSNWAAGLAEHPLDHREVERVAREASARMGRLLSAFIQKASS